MPHATAPAAPPPGQRWDIFCRVIDNHGDAGVCWRLGVDLAARGAAVRLFIDDSSALTWMAPAGAPGVTVLPFDAAATLAAAEVCIEAFGCDPPPAYVQAMARTAPAPVWVNLEYLSAEDYVERSHRLPSPQPLGPMKWFFYPGFTPRTGGLLREPGLQQRWAAFDRAAWLRDQGLELRPGERAVSLFCYADPAPAALHAVLLALARRPTLLLLTPPAVPLLAALVRQQGPLPDALRTHALPWLSQRDYDHLLWSCDLNFVRGEDSLVRAHWAGAPFVWQIYPQHDGAHAAKLEALLARMAAPPAAATLWRAWNGLLPEAQTVLAASAVAQTETDADWRSQARTWCQSLMRQDDLSTQLLAFVAERGAVRPPAGNPPAC
jgi:uncharacterized repeat protein (TIGR03837 family)